MYIVHFKTESGDDYHAVFENKPSEYELKCWMIYHYPSEFEDGQAYIYVGNIIEFPKFYEVDEGDLEYQGLPNPEDIEWL